MPPSCQGLNGDKSSRQSFVRAFLILNVQVHSETFGFTVSILHSVLLEFAAMESRLLGRDRRDGARPGVQVSLMPLSRDQGHLTRKARLQEKNKSFKMGILTPYLLTPPLLCAFPCASLPFLSSSATEAVSSVLSTAAMFSFMTNTVDAEALLSRMTCSWGKVLKEYAGSCAVIKRYL